jgi:pyridoxine 5-phosphate synthase
MGKLHHLRLGVNIDHVATVRNARGGLHPDPVVAALLAAEAGADGITAHLREDRRHMLDADMRRLKDEVPLPLNFEMAATNEMLMIALDIKPNACCLVPENRAERTTEGGLDVAGQETYLRFFAAELKAAGIRVSLFIDPQTQQLEAAHRVGSDIVELHTGRYAELTGATQATELQRIEHAARSGAELGLEMHAGHGLTFANVGAIAAIPQLHELNIGHFLIGEAIFLGIKEAIAQMRLRMNAARA